MTKEIRRLYQHKITRIHGYRVNPHFFKSNVSKSITGYYISSNMDNTSCEVGHWYNDSNQHQLHSIFKNSLLNTCNYYL